MPGLARCARTGRQMCGCRTITATAAHGSGLVCHSRSPNRVLLSCAGVCAHNREAEADIHRMAFGSLCSQSLGAYSNTAEQRLPAQRPHAQRPLSGAMQQQLHHVHVSPTAILQAVPCPRSLLCKASVCSVWLRIPPIQPSPDACWCQHQRTCCFWLVAVRGAYFEALLVSRSCRGPRRRWKSALDSASRSTDVAACAQGVSFVGRVMPAAGPAQLRFQLWGARAQQQTLDRNPAETQSGARGQGAALQLRRGRGGLRPELRESAGEALAWSLLCQPCTLQPSKARISKFTAGLQAAPTGG